MPDESNNTTKRVYRIVPSTAVSASKRKQKTSAVADFRRSESGSPDTSSAPEGKAKKKKKFLRNWKRWLLGIPLSLLLPFILLVRLSSLFYSDYHMNAWIGVLAGAVISLGLFTSIVYLVARRFGLRPGRRSAQILSVVFASYTLYLLVFISASNVKAPEIRETYTALHPAIRLALSTFMLLDRNAVVTDSQRQSADYQKMGLSTPNSSLHYEQQNGFVHAVDLRTNGRSEFRNLLTAAYFRIMGFSTLRHTGTADHLHVSLRIQKS